MGDMLSQAEIDALLNGTSLEEESPAAEASTDIKPPQELLLNEEEKDALGEIGNISMGTSATTLYALLGQKVSITTPRVEETKWDEISRMFQEPYIAIKVQYTQGLMGYNLLILKEEDAKVITDLMMGGDGQGNVEATLNDLHLSAISEAMNQMVGSACTSLSSMFEKRVDISPPESSLVSSSDDVESIRIDKNSNIVAILFKLQVGDLIDSEIMQLLPIDFAKELASNLLKAEESKEPMAAPPSLDMPATPPPTHQPPVMGQPPQQQMPPQYQMPPMQQSYQAPQMPQFQAAPPRSEYQQPVNVQPVQFQTFDDSFINVEQKNIGLLMDVPLQIAVELGRTTKKIREILEFGQGSIIELDKLAGEPVDILVNGKAIAKGEVVVIDESFGVRITDIIHPSKRI
ncbi:MAG: flagellar motor switch phosphatase FliY [Acetivibrionales bacterium]|jgi:flagellar motor switch protein FliN/FliY